VDLLRELQARHDLAYLFISHDLRVVRALSHDVLVMRAGRIVEDGPAETIFENPREAYTRALMAAAFELNARPREVTRVEVELESGAFIALRDGGRTIAATTGPQPTSGLVVYDLRTCLAGITEPEQPKRKKRAPERMPDTETE